MKTLTVPTTLHCAGCVASIKPYFDSSPKVKEWKVDLTKAVKTLTVKGEELQQHDVVSLLHQAGYDILESTEEKSTALPPIGKSEPFWNDTFIWKRASFNMINCLIGCSIGDFGTVIYVQAFYPQMHMFTQMAIATFAGLCTSVMLESVILRVRENFNWRLAFSTAFSMSFISMVTMEIAMNISDFMMTGGKAAFNTSQYWTAFVIASIAGFLTPLPYNYYKLKKFNKACH